MEMYVVMLRNEKLFFVSEISVLFMNDCKT